jgi:hypothetical protein
MKKKLAILLSVLMVLSITALTACGGKTADTTDNADTTEAADTTADTTEDAAADTADDQTDPVKGAAYGYSGDDPVQAAVYQYLVEKIAPQYELPEGAVSIPIVQLVDEDIDSEDGEAEVKGVFWVFNYVIEGDTLKMVSGGNHPGKMELIQVGSGYSVQEFEQVADGSNFEPSARDIFEEHYDSFMKVNGDQESREALRTQIIVDYVKANGLSVTKYQDEGWDPVELPL